MLPDNVLELLTAAVDGELTPRQERHLRRLLDGSADARAVFTRLRGDSLRVRNLPKAVPPAGLTTQIINRLPETVPFAELSRPVRHPQTARPWVPVAIAAS